MDCVDDFLEKSCSHCKQQFTPEYLAQERLKIITRWYIILSSFDVAEGRTNQEKGIFYPSDPNWKGKAHNRYKEFMRKYEAELLQLGFLRKRA